MKIPGASDAASKALEALVPTGPTVTVRKMFGQPAAFVNGNLFFGVFGEDLFVRLSDADRADAERLGEFRPFEPMPGRPMRGYLVLPRPWLRDRKAAAPWVAKALRFGTSLPTKASAKRVSRN